MNDTAKNILLWLVILVIVVTVFNSLGNHQMSQAEISYSEFLHRVEEGQVTHVALENRQVRAQTRDNQRFVTYMPPLEDRSLLPLLLRQGIEIKSKPPEQQSLLTHIFISWVPMLLFIGLWVFFIRQMQGGGGGRGGALSFGRSRARLLEEQMKVTFADVAGADEAVEELSELVEFLKDPGKFQKLGGKIPRGILLVGPPGTGKTLLAKAVSGEARVPFFTISGSDFVEMFVGVGASRVRDMFEQAKKNSPCIIFIDEIDAVGRHRGAGLGGGHDEREQTLNQLLVEMDGFWGGTMDPNKVVIVLAATNRPDVLDRALLRPGRFDRQVVVSLPDIRGRKQILDVHLKKIPIEGDFDSMVIARGTPGFSGADLANLTNEAALLAARANKTGVGLEELEQAKDRVMMGVERRSAVMSDEAKRLTAYHEAGHAIVGRLLKDEDHDPVYKVSIIPRGRALGVTMFLPEEDRYTYTRKRLQSQITSLFGGRIAEQLIFGADRITTGSSNDIERATELARNMVTKWGYSDLLGPIVYGDEQGEVFLGHSVVRRKEVSEQTAHQIDIEVRRIITESYQRAESILQAHMEQLHLMAEALIKYETIDSEQIDAIMMGQTPNPPRGWREALAKNTRENIQKSSESSSNSSSHDSSDSKDQTGKDASTE